MRKLVLILIKGYRLVLSPWLGNHCRFTPSCSQYALTAIERFGLLRGGGLALKRIGCCHPWHPGGCDPVPAADHLLSSTEQQKNCHPHG
jgi:putative membrane protein insertion efficiency factor